MWSGELNYILLIAGSQSHRSSPGLNLHSLDILCESSPAALLYTMEQVPGRPITVNLCDGARESLLNYTIKPWIYYVIFEATTLFSSSWTVGSGKMF